MRHPYAMADDSQDNAPERASRGRRRSSRLRVRLPARIVTRTETRHVILSDVSSGGARIIAGRDLSPGLEAVLEWGRFEAFGEVVWCDGERSGMRFLDPLDERILIATRDLDDAARLPRDSDLVRRVAQGWAEGSARL